jgi:1-acyl-sn-glycerol-3-phosphate acyltransferase
VNQRLRMPYRVPRDEVDMAWFRSVVHGLRPVEQYFRAEYFGFENLPAEGAALVVGNHGPFAIDTPLLVRHTWKARRRVLRMLADRALFTVPIVRDLLAGFGTLEGEPNAALHLLAKGNLVGVYPGGVREAFKGPEGRHRVKEYWGKSLGFVRLAMRAGVPIVPVACAGIDDIYVQVKTAKELEDSLVARALQSYMNNPKYSVALFAGAGVLPLPSRLVYVVGEPVVMPAHGDEAAKDDALVARARDEVADRLERLIDDADAKRAALLGGPLDIAVAAVRDLVDSALRRGRRG